MWETVGLENSHVRDQIGARNQQFSNMISRHIPVHSFLVLCYFNCIISELKSNGSWPGPTFRFQLDNYRSLLNQFVAFNKQESPAIADKPARRESLPKIDPIGRPYNVVADNTGLSSCV